MKRKFYLLALTCAVVGTSVISSCKDTDEDLYTDLKNQLAQSENNYQQLRQKLSEIETKLAEKLKEKGPQGDKGDKGDKGDQGEAGADGKSAYEIWLGQDGNAGKSEAEFLQSLIGPKGENGKDADEEAIYNKLLEALNAYETKEEHQTDYNYILGLIKDLDAITKKLVDVSGVVIQNVYNPAFGFVSLPLNIQSNILLSYYSEVEKSEFFPARKAVDFGMSSEELNAIGFTPQTFDLTEAVINVGKVYMTVNPTNVDFSGKTPILVNSKGQEDGITLSALEACDETLYFGYTRAASNLYVADAKVTDLGATEKLNLNIEKNAKTIKNAIKEGDNKAGVIVRTVYEMLNNVCQRKAVQLSNTNSTVMSELGLAAALVKPMGFDTVEKFGDTDYMAKLKDAVAPTTGKSSVDEVLSAVGSALDNLYARTLPAIVYTADGETHHLLSIDPAKPTKLASTITLFPVSYSAEILVPYIMKHVAVVKVTGAADNAKAMVDANNSIHMNCIINRDQCHELAIDLAGLESGATYELVYSAMDFAGAVRAQRFYFTVK